MLGIGPPGCWTLIVGNGSGRGADGGNGAREGVRPSQHALQCPPRHPTASKPISPCITIGLSVWKAPRGKGEYEGFGAEPPSLILIAPYRPLSMGEHLETIRRARRDIVAL